MSDVFTVIQTEKDIFRIEIEMVRAWLFIGKEKALLVDTTMAEGDLFGAVTSLTDLPVILVNTHADPDHIACNGQFEAAYMHPAEFDHYNEMSQEGFAQAKPVEDKEKIDIGGRVFEVIHIPGHTPGSIALLDRKNRILVAGDTISANPVFMFGDARNCEDFRSSLLRLKELSGEFDEIYTSHGAFCVDKSQIDNELICLEECLAGIVLAEDPPFPIPAKMYRSHGAGFFLSL